jgi:NAD(P)-dependent dehydrogenase (short-subunit alcohol dehydrogenase family)
MTDRPVAIVTGASRGIGSSIAARLEAVGFIAVRTADTWDAAADNHYTADIADLGAHEPLVAQIVGRFGRIDCLVNNAGIGSPVRGDFINLRPQDFDRVLAVNLRGTIFFTQAVVRAMLAAGNPGPARTVIFITSASATAASPERLDYCVSKAGLAMFAKGLALRLAEQGIAVFEVRPGIIRTQMTSAVASKYDKLIADGAVPERRWGEPEDIASIVASLAGNALPFSTGSVIEAGGGLAIPKL